MKKYIGVKLIQAEPMELNGQEGYLIVDESVKSSECLNGLSKDVLHELFDYKDGNLYWINAPRGFRGDISKPAGAIDKSTGYRKVGINGTYYYAHRLVFIYHFGNSIANLEIDHLNHDREDNHIENLRLVTRQENAFNFGGNHGVSFDKTRSKWQAYIDVDGKRITLGRFDTEEEAVAVRAQAKEKYHIIDDNLSGIWSPKEVFEKAYMQVGDNNTVEEHNVNDFIVSYDVNQWGDKTTVVHATLANGFILTESSSCVDAANFNMDIGYNVCKEKIQNRVWGFLGFLLQCGVNGIKKGE